MSLDPYSLIKSPLKTSMIVNAVAGLTVTGFCYILATIIRAICFLLLPILLMACQKPVTALSGDDLSKSMVEGRWERSDVREPIRGLLREDGFFSLSAAGMVVEGEWLIDPYYAIEFRTTRIDCDREIQPDCVVPDCPSRARYGTSIEQGQMRVWVLTDSCPEREEILKGSWWLVSHRDHHFSGHLTEALAAKL